MMRLAFTPVAAEGPVVTLAPGFQFRQLIFEVSDLFTDHAQVRSAHCQAAPLYTIHSGF
jgi:hypothetical protein